MLKVQNNQDLGTADINQLMTGFHWGRNWVSPSTGQIKNAASSRKIEPKVMEVLLVLVSEPGRVVSNQEIFERVWKGGIFHPGLVQRAISLLRKSLTADPGSDIILTHPKLGYSANRQYPLIWPECDDPEVSHLKTNLRRFAVVCLVLVGVAVAGILWMSGSSSISFKSMTPLTVTGQQEYGGRFSPDHLLLGFIRNDKESELRRIWVKNLLTEKETAISEPALIRNFYWETSSASVLYLVEKENSTDVVRQYLPPMKGTENMFSVSDDGNVSDIFIDGTGRVYYLDRGHGEAKLHRWYQGKTDTLMGSSADFTPYAMSLSHQGSQLAIMGFDQKMQTEVKIFQPETGLISPVAHLTRGIYSLTWYPDDSQLVVSNGRTLQSLRLDGELTALPFSNYSYIQQLDFKGGSQPGLSFTMFKEDTDILLLDVVSPTHDNVTLVADSNARDWAPVFSPNGQQLVYVTDRKGYPQLMLINLSTGKERVLFANPRTEMFMSPPFWHSDGERVGFALNNNFLLVSIDTAEIVEQVFDMPLGVPVQWYTHQDAILTMSNVEQSQRLALGTWSFKELSDVKHNWAHLLEDDNLVLVSDAGLYTSELYPYPLEGRVIHSFVHHNHIYINIRAEGSTQVWKFDPDLAQYQAVINLTQQRHLLWAIHPVSGQYLIERRVQDSDILMLH